MTQIEKIKAEIERRMLEDYNSSDAQKDEIAQGVCAGILTFINSLPQEPVSEDLEKYEKEYFEKWKDEIISVYDRHAGFVDGAQWQKEQMLKDAVEGEVHKMGNIAYIKEISQDAIQGALKDFADRDKVKLIIIKED